MRVLIPFLIFSFLAVSTSSVSAETAAPPGFKEKEQTKKIAVMSIADFVPELTETDNSSGAMPMELTGRIIQHLEKSGRFTPVERESIRRVILEQRYQDDPRDRHLEATVERAIEDLDKVSGNTVVATASFAIANDLISDFIDLGTAVQADYLVIGNIEELEQETGAPFPKGEYPVEQVVNKIRLNVRVVDVNRGTIIGTTNIKSEFNEATVAGLIEPSDLLDIYDRLALKTFQSILDIAFPARVVETEPLIISRGILDGFNKGDTLQLIREGKAIFDENEIPIGAVKNKVGILEITEPQENISQAKLIDGGPAAAGDIVVRLSAEPLPTPARSTMTDLTKGPAVIALGNLQFAAAASIDKDIDAGVLPRLTELIEAKLIKTGRFQLMERHRLDELINEKALTAAFGGKDLQKLLGELSGVDYLVYGSVSSIFKSTKTDKIAILDEVDKRTAGIAEGIIRIVEVKTGRIITADPISISLRLDKNRNTTAEEEYSGLLTAFAGRAVSSVMNSIYPVQVVHAASKEKIFINRGQDGGLATEQTFQILRPGIPLTDPDTGIPMGTAEEELGTLQLVTVENARSIGKLISGTVPARGDILKKVSISKNRELKVLEPNW